MSHEKFKFERRRALEEIRDALTQDLEAMAKSVRRYDSTQAPLTEYLRVQEMFHVSAVAMHAVSVFLGTPMALAPAGKSGRASAFEDILNVLNALETNFDRDYKPLDRNKVQYWQRRQPLNEKTLQLVFKENQRYYMKESIEKLKGLIKGIEGHTVAPPRYKPPHPPRF